MLRRDSIAFPAVYAHEFSLRSRICKKKGGIFRLLFSIYYAIYYYYYYCSRANESALCTTRLACLAGKSILISG